MPNHAPPNSPSLEPEHAVTAQGVKIVAPPMWALLTVEKGKIVPLQYAQEAKAPGLDIITWTVERSGRIVEEVLPTEGTSSPSFYYSTFDALDNDEAAPDAPDVLAKRSASLDFLRLVSDGDLIRQLHGLEIVPLSPGEGWPAEGSHPPWRPCAGP